MPRGCCSFGACHIIILRPPFYLVMLTEKILSSAEVSTLLADQIHLEPISARLMFRLSG